MAESALSKLSLGARMALSVWRGRQRDFEELEGLLQEGCRPLLGRVISFAEVLEAFELLEGGGFAGKLVVRVGAEGAQRGPGAGTA